MQCSKWAVETEFLQDNPLLISLHPPHNTYPGAYLEFSFLLNASLDIFELRARDRTRVDQDLGLLQSVDERLSIWGWETGTGARFAIVLDAWGKGGVEGPKIAIKDGDLKSVRHVSALGIRLRRWCLVQC